MLFGITALVFVGLSWTLTGIVMSEAPKKGLRPAMVLLLSGIISTPISPTILLFTGIGDCSLRGFFIASVIYFMATGINFMMLQLMSYAMQRGPNGVIWSIIQSALIFPFLIGILFFGSKFSLSRGIGVVLLLIALGFLAASKNNTTQRKNWKLPTFVAFVSAGLVITLKTIPSYYPDMQQINSVARAFVSHLGAMSTALI